MAVKTLWQRVLGRIDIPSEDRAQGQKLFREFSRLGSLRITPVQRVALSPGAVIDFYRRLSLVKTASGPVVRRQDDRWLRNGDFQFIDLREYGTFFRVLMEIPRLRADSVVFLPLTEGEDPLYPRSHAQLNHRFSDPYLESLGLKIEDQLRLLVQAVHLCGKTAGYYMSPLLDPLSAVIYRKPEFFSWRSERLPDASREDIVQGVNNAVARHFEQTGAYDYDRIRSLLRQEGLSVGKGTEPVCFDFSDERAMEYFIRIFSALQGAYSLDFFYLDLPPLLDDATAARVYKALRTRAGCKRYTGWVTALQNGHNPPADPREPVVLVHEAKDRFPLEEAEVHEWFHQLGRLFEKNRGRRIPLTQGMVLRKGRDREDLELLRRLFLCRFSGAGLFRRALLFGGDVSALSNRMEDVYHRYKPLLERGRLLQVVADEDFAWWVISDRGRLLIPLMALDGQAEREGRKPPIVRIDYSSITGRKKILSVVDYDFSSSAGSLFLSADNSLVVTDLKPGSFRLFSLQ